MVLRWISPYRSWLRCGALFELSLSYRFKNCYRLVAVYKKKFFFFFYPHTLTFYCNRLIDNKKECEGKCEGKFLALTLTLSQDNGAQTIPVAIDKCTYRASIRNVIEYCLVNKQEKRYQKSAAP